MSSYDQSAEHGASLQSHLTLALHAFAQPLSVLRAKLYLESIARLDADGLHQLAVDSAGQVERLCTLFNYVQEIVVAETSEPVLVSVSVKEVLDHTIDGVELWYRDAGLRLTLDSANDASYVYADKTMLLRALSSLTVLAHRLSKTGETVQVGAHSDAGSTEISLTNREVIIANPSAEARLTLALVETNIRKQLGTFRWSTQPLAMSVRVPNAPITP